MNGFSQLQLYRIIRWEHFEIFQNINYFSNDEKWRNAFIRLAKEKQQQSDGTHRNCVHHQQNNNLSVIEWQKQISFAIYEWCRRCVDPDLNLGLGSSIHAFINYYIEWNCFYFWIIEKKCISLRRRLAFSSLHILFFSLISSNDK